MDKRVVTKNFSKFANSYDEHTPVQRRCSERLVELIREDRFLNILEIGCGTGSHTALLSEYFKDSSITAIDVSPGMVDIAKKKINDPRINFLVRDGEDLDFDHRHDLITSNASFQWFQDIGKTMESISNRLSPGGKLCFSMYGPQTFCELKDVLSFHFGSRRWLSSSKFISRDDLEVVLKRYFKKFEIMEEKYEANFFSLWEFLKNVQSSGTRGEGLGKDLYLGKYMINEMEKTYVEKFGGITATHHVFFCVAEK